MRANRNRLRWFQFRLATALFIWLAMGPMIGLILAPAVERAIAMRCEMDRSRSPGAPATLVEEQPKFVYTGLVSSSFGERPYLERKFAALEGEPAARDGAVSSEFSLSIEALDPMADRTAAAGKNLRSSSPSKK
jgi:hypothetical protein